MSRNSPAHRRPASATAPPTALKHSLSVDIPASSSGFFAPDTHTRPPARPARSDSAYTYPSQATKDSPSRMLVQGVPVVILTGDDGHWAKLLSPNPTSENLRQSIAKRVFETRDGPNIKRLDLEDDGFDDQTTPPASRGPRLRTRSVSERPQPYTLQQLGEISYDSLLFNFDPRITRLPIRPYDTLPPHQRVSHTIPRSRTSFSVRDLTTGPGSSTFRSLVDLSTSIGVPVLHAQISDLTYPISGIPVARIGSGLASFNFASRSLPRSSSMGDMANTRAYLGPSQSSSRTGSWLSGASDLFSVASRSTSAATSRPGSDDEIDTGDHQPYWRPKLASSLKRPLRAIVNKPNEGFLAPPPRSSKKKKKVPIEPARLTHSMAAADPSGEDDSGFEADCESITSQFEEFFATSPTSSTIEAGDRGFIPLERVRARNVDGSGAARRGKMSTIAKAIAATGTIGTSIGQAVTLIASSKGRMLALPRTSLTPSKRSFPKRQSKISSDQTSNPINQENSLLQLTDSVPGNDGLETWNDGPQLITASGKIIESPRKPPRRAPPPNELENELPSLLSSAGVFDEEEDEEPFERSPPPGLDSVRFPPTSSSETVPITRQLLLSPRRKPPPPLPSFPSMEGNLPELPSQISLEEIGGLA